MSSIKIKIYPIKNEYLEYLEPPYQAIKKNPEWIKKTSSYYTPSKNIDEYNMPTSTIKNCMPVRDLIGSGYHIPLPCDVWVEKQEDEFGETFFSFRWALDSLNLIEVHNEKQSKTLPVYDCFNKQPFKFNNFWIFETPKNWSCLFTHPFYYDDLPFRTLGGLVDTDNFPLSVNFPFYIKNDFEGLIPKGTPIAQVIPFKRESFDLSVHKENKNLLYSWYKASSSFFNIYKNNFRSKKIFNITKCPFHVF